MKTRSFRKKDFQSIIWMVFVLVTIVLVMQQLNRRIVNQPPELALLAADERIAVVDSVYFHLPFYLTWRLPNSSWKFTSAIYDSLLNPVTATAPLYPQITWLATAEYKNTSSNSMLGILEYSAEPDDLNEAIKLLYEFIALNSDSTEVITPVSKGAHAVLGGVYFLIKTTTQQTRINVVAVLPRKNWLYVIKSSTSETDYTERRTDLESCVSQFRALSMLK